MSEYDDPYSRSGQFIDLMIAGWWEHHGTTIADALRELPADDGPVVDAGAGGGLGTRLIARTLPQVRVLAIEPSLPLRSALLSRVFEDPELRPRVTVDGADLLTARLPDRISGLVAANLLGHFSPHERNQLWDSLAPRLAPGAFILVNLLEPAEPAHVERTRMPDLHIGERSYTGWAGAEPAGSDQVSWHMTYEVHEGPAHQPRRGPLHVVDGLRGRPACRGGIARSACRPARTARSRFVQNASKSRREVEMASTDPSALTATAAIRAPMPASPSVQEVAGRYGSTLFELAIVWLLVQ